MVFAILSSLVSLSRELYDACTAAFRLLLAFFSFLYGALNVMGRPPPLESIEIYTGFAALFPPLLHQLNLTWQAASTFGLHLLCLPPRALVIAIEAVKALHPLDSPESFFPLLFSALIDACIGLYISLAAVAIGVLLLTGIVSMIMLQAEDVMLETKDQRKQRERVSDLLFRWSFHLYKLRLALALDLETRAAIDGDYEAQNNVELLEDIARALGMPWEYLNLGTTQEGPKYFFADTDLVY
jgi:hypothetical protein